MLPQAITIIIIRLSAVLFHVYKRLRCVRVHWFCEDESHEWKLLSTADRFVEIAVSRNQIKIGDILAVVEFPKIDRYSTNMLQVHRLHRVGDPIDCWVAQCRMLRVFESMTILRSMVEDSFGFSPESSVRFYAHKDCLRNNFE
jgi:hypothetical protein